MADFNASRVPPRPEARGQTPEARSRTRRRVLVRLVRKVQSKSHLNYIAIPLDFGVDLGSFWAPKLIKNRCPNRLLKRSSGRCRRPGVFKKRDFGRLGPLILFNCFLNRILGDFLKRFHIKSYFGMYFFQKCL